VKFSMMFLAWKCSRGIPAMCASASSIVPPFGSGKINGMTSDDLLHILRMYMYVHVCNSMYYLLPKKTWGSRHNWPPILFRPGPASWHLRIDWPCTLLLHVAPILSISFNQIWCDLLPRDRPRLDFLAFIEMFQR
jgi:hypothetical protein